jgi:outer membrane receptor for ferrienterochelin and colicin
MNYTRRVGDASVRYGNFQLGGYAQDDFRVARSLLLSYGVRYEAQTLIHDQNNWSPRGTITWSPFKKTERRRSAADMGF